MSREVNTIGMTIAQALETKRQVGARNGAGVRRLVPATSTTCPCCRTSRRSGRRRPSSANATPKFYTVDEFCRGEYRDLRPQSLYASPWPAAGGASVTRWIHGDGVPPTLEYAGKYREELLWNRYQAGRNAIAPYFKSRPTPTRAAGAGATRRPPPPCSGALAFSACAYSELFRATPRNNGRALRQGTWVIPMNQEYAELVRQLSNVQAYPDPARKRGRRAEPPYDAAGWTHSLPD